MSEGTPPPPEPPGGQTDQSGGTPPPPPASAPPPAGGYGTTPPPPQSAPPPAASPTAAGGYQTAPPPPPPVTGPRPGELLDRFVARLIDGILVGIVNAIIISVVIVGIIGLNGANAFGYGSTFGASIASAVIGVVLNLGYFALMDSSQGRTLGKMVMKLHVEGASGGKPTIEESIKRNWWLGLPILGVVPIIGGLIGSLAELVIIIMIAVQINSDPERRPALSDRFANTRVVKEG